MLPELLLEPPLPLEGALGRTPFEPAPVPLDPLPTLEPDELLPKLDGPPLNPPFELAAVLETPL